MKIYINDVPVRISDQLKDKERVFDVELSDKHSEIQMIKLKGRVLIKNKTSAAIDHLLKIMTSKKYAKIKSIDIIVKNKKKAEKQMISRFDIVIAAGGIVEKDGKILMILRNNLWDIPKGKLEEDESRPESAVREVEEETGAKVEIIEKISATWHTYIRNKKFVLKKTHWYRMKCLDDSNIQPQKEENIKKAVWMTESEVDIALEHSYKTIKRLIKTYRKMEKHL